MQTPSKTPFYLSFDWICLEVMGAVLVFAPSWLFALSPIYLILQVALYPDRYRTRQGSLTPAFVLVGAITVLVLISAIIALSEGQKPF